jgi:hypothetical protein
MRETIDEIIAAMPYHRKSGLEQLAVSRLPAEAQAQYWRDRYDRIVPLWSAIHLLTAEEIAIATAPSGYRRRGRSTPLRVLADRLCSLEKRVAELERQKS